MTIPPGSLSTMVNKEAFVWKFWSATRKAWGQDRGSGGFLNVGGPKSSRNYEESYSGFVVRFLLLLIGTSIFRNAPAEMMILKDDHGS